MIFSVPNYERVNESLVRYNYSELFANIVSEVRRRGEKVDSDDLVQNDWVGDLDWIPTVIQTTFWAGNIPGCLVWGLCNDRFGRRNTIFWSHVVYFIGNLGTLLLPVFLYLMESSTLKTVLTVSLLSLFRLSAGFSHHTVAHLPCLLALEYCGINHRTIPIMCLMVSYCLASISTPLLSSLMSHWSQLAIPTTALVLPVILLSRSVV